MNKIMSAGAVLIVLGILGFAVPYFTTSQTKDVAKLGDLKIEATENKTHAIPPAASGGVLILGVLVFGAGFYRRA